MNYTTKKFDSIENWSNWKNSCVSTEDAPVIMGENPWKTIDELLKEKTEGKELPKNEKMEKALQVRPFAEEAYKKIVGVAFEEKITKANIENITKPWQIASLDGVILTKKGPHIVEIKVGEYAYKKATENKTKFPLKKGKIPNFYYGEAQHLLSTSGMKYITFFFFNENKIPIVTKVFRNEEYINTLEKKEIEFLIKLKEAKNKDPKKIISTINSIRNKEWIEVDLYKKLVPEFITKEGTATKAGAKLLVC